MTRAVGQRDMATEHEQNRRIVDVVSREQPRLRRFDDRVAAPEDDEPRTLEDLLPAIFAVRAISFWQALGLLLLCRILFGSFGVHRSSHGWRHRFAERWERMTPDERERFLEGTRARRTACQRASEPPAQ